jgi:hypothetical protein
MDGKFDQAKVLLDRMADGDVKIFWNTDGVPEGMRSDLAAERDLVIADWQSRIAGFKPNFVKAGADVEFRFNFDEASQLAISPGSGEAQPLITFTIPLGKQIKAAKLHNDLSYSIGSYLGLSDLRFPGFVMNHSFVATDRMRPHPYEFAFGVQIFNFLDQVRRAINSKTAIMPSTPRVEIETKSLKSEPVVQGSRPAFKINLKSTGEGKLLYIVVPDCSCFSTGSMTEVEPGKSTTAPVQMDTTEFGGLQSKKLYVVTNDARNSVTEVPVEVPIIERYRFSPAKGQVFVLPKGGKVLETFLVFPKGKPFKIKSSSLEGLPGKLELSTWEGQVPGAEGEPNKEILKGYRLRIDMRDLPISGRLGALVRLETDDPIFPEVTYPMLLQQGILASPMNLYLGDIGSAARDASFLVTRPGEPFKILKVTSDSEHLTCRIDEAKGEYEYKIHVLYDGKAAKGSYAATITIETDDPDQPKILVPVSAQVK